LVGVFNAENEFSIRLGTGIHPVEQCGAGSADVQESRRAWSESDSNHSGKLQIPIAKLQANHKFKILIFKKL